MNEMGMSWVEDRSIKRSTAVIRLKSRQWAQSGYSGWAAGRAAGGCRSRAMREPGRKETQRVHGGGAASTVS